MSWNNLVHRPTALHFSSAVREREDLEGSVLAYYRGREANNAKFHFGAQIHDN